MKKLLLVLLAVVLVFASDTAVFAQFRSSSYGTRDNTKYSFASSSKERSSMSANKTADEGKVSSATVMAMGRMAKGFAANKKVKETEKTEISKTSVPSRDYKSRNTYSYGSR